MDDLLTIPKPALRSRRPGLVPAVVVAMLLAVAFVVVGMALRTPEHVSLTVDNSTEFRAEVMVRGAEDGPRTGAGAVSRGGELEFIEVPDQGEDWFISFAYAGQTEEVRISRQALIDQGWRVEVPADLARQLDAAGVPPTTGSGSN